MTLHELKNAFDETAQDITQVLPKIAQWPDALLYFLKALEVKATELYPKQQREFENTLRYIMTGIKSRLGEDTW